jgi:hypothetical protein
MAPEGSAEALGRVDGVAGAFGLGLLLGAVIAADPAAGGADPDPAFGQVDRLGVVVALKLLHRAERSHRYPSRAMGTDERPPTFRIVGDDSSVV